MVLGIWVLFVAWVVGYSSLGGFLPRPAAPGTVEGVPAGSPPVPLLLGIPGWVFWGVALPWVVATVATILFGAFVLRDDPLGEDNSPGPTRE